MKFLIKLILLNIFSIYNHSLNQNFLLYSFIFIRNIFLHPKNITNIKNYYDEYNKKQTELKDFYEDLEFIIFAYLILRANLSKEQILNIISDLEDPKDLTKEESFFYKLLIKKKILFNLIKNNISIDNHFSKNENNSKENIFYNNLIITGDFKNNIDKIIGVIKKINEYLFLEDFTKELKKLNIKNLKIKYKVTKKPLESFIDHKNKNFKIIAYSHTLSSYILYELDIFEFENENIPNRIISIFKENPSINGDNFHKYLFLNKIIYSHKTIFQNNKDLHPSINNILNNKNINDKFVMGNRIIIIKSKSFYKPSITLEKKNQEDMDTFLYTIIKNKVLKFMKNYYLLINFIKSS
jgi:hypothetical protein